jgi:NAD(P)H-quinone oxidoreductase subunit 4
MLSTLILLPLIGAAVIGFYPTSISGKTARQISLAIAGMIFLWTVLLTIKFDPNQGNVQFTESLIWIDVLGLNYRLGVDGLSLPLLLLNGILTVIAIYSTDESIQRPKFYYSLIFLLSTGVIGAFLAQDLLLFFLFYELELIPLYLLIAIWGGIRKGYAATKFLIYTALSGILILASFLGMIWLSHSPSFALETVNAHTLPSLSYLVT